MSNFSDFIADAKELIAEEGRLVELRQEVQTAPDPLRPWRVISDISIAPLIDVKSVFINYESKEIDGELVKRGDKKCLIASDDAVIQKADIRHYSLIIDRGEEWVIWHMNILDPGDEVIMYTLQLRKL